MRSPIFRLDPQVGTWGGLLHVSRLSIFLGLGPPSKFSFDCLHGDQSFYLALCAGYVGGFLYYGQMDLRPSLTAQTRPA